jgi:hypothetical protein
VEYVMTYRAVEDFLPLAQQHGVVAGWTVRPWDEVLAP